MKWIKLTQVNRYWNSSRLKNREREVNTKGCYYTNANGKFYALKLMGRKDRGFFWQLERHDSKWAYDNTPDSLEAVSCSHSRKADHLTVMRSLSMLRKRATPEWLESQLEKNRPIPEVVNNGSV